MYITIYVLLNNTVSSSDYTTLYSGMTSK